MARKARASRGKTSVRVDMSNVGKAFEPGQEYAVRVLECTLEEGQKAPYFNMKLAGLEDSEYANSYMYHRASTGESSLWRLRPLMEAFGFEIPDGPLDIDAGDFIGREAMCSTYLDRYEGGSSVKPDEFWELEGGSGGDSGDDFDLDELSDEDIETLAGILEVKGKTVSAMRKALAKLDEDEVAEAWENRHEGGEDEGDEASEFDLDDLDDDQVMELAAELGNKAKTAKRARSALAKMDVDELAEAWEGLKEGSDDKGSGDAEDISEDAVQEMNQDELEEVVERFDLDLDLTTMKTLRKMKNAVIDALEEGGHFD